MTTWLKVVVVEGEEGRGWLSDEAGEGGSVRQRGSGWEGVTSLCIKLEKFIIYHYTQPENATQLSPPPNQKHHGERGEGREEKKLKKKKKKLSEPQQQPMGKINMQIYARN